MIGYIYWENSRIINNIINDVTYINDNEGDNGSKEIRNSNNEIARFNGGSDFIILMEDTIHLNIGDVIVLDGLIDARTFFTKGQDFWYQEQIKNANESNKNLQNTATSLNETVANQKIDNTNTMMAITELYEIILV